MGIYYIWIVIIHFIKQGSKQVTRNLVETTKYSKWAYHENFIRFCAR